MASSMWLASLPRRRPIPAALLLALVAPSERATAREPEPPSFGASTARVAIDLVVRGKEGEILRGLTAKDVEVYEDGVRQQVESLQFVERGAFGDAASPTDKDALPQTLLAIVIDSLSPEGRRAAHDAVLQHLNEPLRTPPLIAIFSIEHGLRLLQAFTDNPETQRRALERLASGGSVVYSGQREREDIRHAHAGLGDGTPQSHVAPAEQAGEPECRLGGDDLVRRFKVLSSRMKESFDILERDQRGAASANALLALVDGLSGLPGRKAVLLFSEGLALPAGVYSTFQSVVAAANRANVSVYAADAGGLRARSVAEETRRALDILRVRLEVMQAAPPATRGPSSAEQPDSGLALLERSEDNLRLAPESGLGLLADQTGGFLVHGTNDLASGLRRIDEELGAYYLISYTPKKGELDGRFRNTSVKVRRPHGALQARRGYFALATSLPTPLLDHEARALARLESGPLPTLVPVRLRVLQFPVDPPQFVVPIVVEVPPNAFAPFEDGKGRARRRDFTILAVVRDGEGRVVAKASQRYALAMAGGQSGAGESQPVVFYREARLPPGAYTIEAMAQDAQGSRAGGARMALDLRAADSGQLRASSLVLVGKAEKLEAGDDSAPQPLRYRDVLLHPLLGSPLRATTQPEVVLFLTAWPSPERPGVEALVEVVRDGRVLVKAPAGRQEADPDGRVQFASSLPLGSLGPGAYELRMTLTDGRDALTRSTPVKVAR
jgi:VWFA-related protein